MLKEDYIGTGPFAGVCEQINTLFHAINKARVVMPSGFVGSAPTIELRDGRLTLDMKNTALFDPSTVEWRLTSDGWGGFTHSRASVENGRLVIEVNYKE